MLRRRGGRPGLVGTMARTAVIAGTASAVSGRVQRGAAERAADEQTRQAQQQQVIVDQAAAQAAASLQAQPAGQPAATSTDEKINKIRDLAKLHTDGILTDEEFTAAKASLLGI